MQPDLFTASQIKHHKTFLQSSQQMPLSLEKSNIVRGKKKKPELLNNILRKTDFWIKVLTNSVSKFLKHHSSAYHSIPKLLY